MKLSDRELVDELCQIESGLTGWEVSFVESIAHWVHDLKRPLSTKSGGQRDKAEKILEEKAS